MGRRRRLESADLHFQAGDVERALGVLEGAAEEAPPGPARAAVLLRLGRLRAETHGADEAIALWREALAESGDDDELRARVLLELGQFLRFTEGAEAALEQLRAAVDTAARVDDDDLRCRTLAAHALVHFNSGRGIDDEGMGRAQALEASLADGGTRMPDAVLRPPARLVRSGGARTRGSRTVALVGARPEHPDESDAAWYLALLEWRAGNWEAAAAAAASAITLSEQFGREAVTIAAWPAAVIAAHRGELDEASRLASEGSARPPAARRRGGLRVGARLHRPIAR